MDIICPVCAEPWDMSELHEAEGMSFTAANNLFHTKGCGAVFGGSCKPVTDPGGRLRADVSAAMFDMMGDDVDGIAAMMEDFDMMGDFDL